MPSRTSQPIVRTALLVQLGGPGMLIGLGGGAASSMDTGANIEDLDFDSVQRGNAEIERRAQEVIDRCWALGERIRSCRSTTSARAACRTRCPSSCMARVAAGASTCARFPREEPGMSPVQIWCNEAQERYVLAIAPERFDVFKAHLRARALPVRRGRQGHRRRQAAGRRPAVRQQPGRHGPRRAARQAAENDARRQASRARAAGARPVRRSSWTKRPRACCSLPAVADKTFLISIGDRTRRRPVLRATRWSGRGRCRSPTSRSR